MSQQEKLECQTKKKSEKIVAIKGMNDILPADAPLWELFENTAETVLKSYGYQKIARPSSRKPAVRARHRRRHRHRREGNVFLRPIR
jgi:hypothetical protein